MKIILIGFMGSGKSSVAKKLKHLLKLPILDMDELVLQKTNTNNMHEVFAKGGEGLLRKTELSIAKEYASVHHHIVSTGGGAVMDHEILQNLKGKDGIIFFLNASYEVITDRLRDDAMRPLAKSKLETKSLYLLREPEYLKYADHVIDVDHRSIDEIAHEIADNSK